MEAVPLSIIDIIRGNLICKLDHDLAVPNRGITNIILVSSSIVNAEPHRVHVPDFGETMAMIGEELYDVNFSIRQTHKDGDTFEISVIKVDTKGVEPSTS